MLDGRSHLFSAYTNLSIYEFIHTWFQHHDVVDYNDDDDGDAVGLSLLIHYIQVCLADVQQNSHKQFGHFVRFYVLLLVLVVLLIVRWIMAHMFNIPSNKILSTKRSISLAKKNTQK